MFPIACLPLIGPTIEDTGMEILGHSDLKMVNRYVRLDQAHKRKAPALLPGGRARIRGTTVPNGAEEEKRATG